MSNPCLVENIRCNVAESFHTGSMIVFNQDKVLFEYGDCRNRKLYFRSSAKPFQTMAILESGISDRIDFSLEEIALISSSHNGEKFHTDLVRNILKKIDVKDESLKCGTHRPFHQETKDEILRSNKDFNVLHNNCSAKHSGMLAMAKHLRESLENYLDLSHPVQDSMRKMIALYTEYEPDELHPGIDGCSAPIYALPLYPIGRAYMNWIDPPESFPESVKQSAAKVLESYQKHPEMVAGTGQFSTRLMQATKGRVIGKRGAQGLYSAAIPEKKIALAIKCDDGSEAYQLPVLYALEQLGIFDADTKTPIHDLFEREIKTHSGITVGNQILSQEFIDAYQKQTVK